LKEYLESRESEVITIMMSLYDEEEVMKIYVESEKNDLRCEMAKNMINDGKLSLETIAQYSGLSIEDVKELQSKMMQPVG
jgi:predicted HTH domain antitoxin